MKNKFYERALAAAKKSPEAFAAEFEKKDADVNVKEYSVHGLCYGSPLIHGVIETIPDEKIPALLTILIQKGMDLESTDDSDRASLALAAYYYKKQTVEFLIKHKANINASEQPALCSAINLGGAQEKALNIIKILLESKANINIQDKFSKSPLFHAAESRQLEIMQYLISRNADLFSRYTFNCGTEYQTALGEAFERYLSAKKCFKEEDSYTKHAKRCLDTLVQAAVEVLYQRGIKEPKAEEFIARSVKELAGSYSGVDSNSNGLQGYLETTIIPMVLARIRKDRVDAFSMGAKLCKTDLEQKMIPPVHHFFQHDGRKDLTKEIFSYVQPVKKMRGK